MNTGNYVGIIKWTDLRMNPSEYERIARERDTDYNDMCMSQLADENMARLVHACLGMAGECGEAVDMVKKHLMFGKQWDRTKFINELGDILFYMHLALHSVGSSFNEAFKMNAEKLQKRYPNGFNREDALLRRDENENK